MFQAKDKSPANILFVTWDGPQTTYLESLFLPIFNRLSEGDFRFHILQFTWGATEQISRTFQACEAAGVSYQAVNVWRRPVAMGALLTAIKGVRDMHKAIFRNDIDAVMARSTLPALMTLLALRDKTLPFIFDAEGLPMDDRVDFAGRSPSSLAYRFLRDVEAQAVRRADIVLTRSHKAADILLARAGAGTSAGKFHVVTNGRDASLFKPADAKVRAQMRRDLGLGVDIPLLVYAGSMGPQYCVDEMLRLFAMIRERRSDAHFLVLTGSPEGVQPALDKYPRLHGCVTTLAVPALAVPQYLACADLGLALRRPSFSMQAVAPIKLGEYLLCGLPVVATAGIGDTAAITPDAGVLLQRMDDAELNVATDWFFDSVLPQREQYRASSRAVGLSLFSLEASTASYRKALEYLGEALWTRPLSRRPAT